MRSSVCLLVIVAAACSTEPVEEPEAAALASFSHTCEEEPRFAVDEHSAFVHLGGKEVWQVSLDSGAKEPWLDLAKAIPDFPCRCADLALDEVAVYLSVDCDWESEGNAILPEVPMALRVDRSNKSVEVLLRGSFAKGRHIAKFKDEVFLATDDAVWQVGKPGPDLITKLNEGAWKEAGAYDFSVSRDYVMIYQRRSYSDPDEYTGYVYDPQEGRLQHEVDSHLPINAMVERDGVVYWSTFGRGLHKVTLATGESEDLELDSRKLAADESGVYSTDGERIARVTSFGAVDDLGPDHLPGVFVDLATIDSRVFGLQFFPNSPCETILNWVAK